MSPAERNCLGEIVELQDALVRLAGPAARPIVNRLDALRGQAASDAEDRALLLDARCLGNALLLRHFCAWGHLCMPSRRRPGPHAVL
jgi:hypothetical protein